MSESFSFAGNWNDQTKAAINEWIRSKLTEMQGEPPEDLFLEYIIIMIGNGKTMAEISHELNDFFSEGESAQFTDNLAIELKKYSTVIIPKPSTTTTIPTARKSTAGGGAVVSSTVVPIPEIPTENVSSATLSSSRSGGSSSNTTRRISSVAQKVVDSESTFDNNHERNIRQQHQPLQSAKMNRLLQSAMANTSHNSPGIASTHGKRKIVYDSISNDNTSFQDNKRSSTDGDMRIIRTVKPNISDTNRDLTSLVTNNTSGISTGPGSAASATAAGFDPQAYMQQMNDMTKIIAQQQQMLNAMTLQQQQQAQAQQVPSYGMIPPQSVYHNQQQQYYPNQQQQQPHYHAGTHHAATQPPTAPRIAGTGYFGKKGLHHKSTADVATPSMIDGNVGTVEKFTSIIQTEPLGKSKKFSKPIETTAIPTTDSSSSSSSSSIVNAIPSVDSAIVNGAISVPSSAALLTAGGRGYNIGGRQQPPYYSGGGRGRGRGGRGSFDTTYHPNQTFIAGAGVGAAIQSPLLMSSSALPVSAASAVLTSSGGGTSTNNGFFYQPPATLATAPVIGGGGGRFNAITATSGRGRGRGRNATVAAGRGIANKKWVRDVSDSMVASAAHSAASSNSSSSSSSNATTAPIESTNSSSAS